MGKMIRRLTAIAALSIAAPVLGDDSAVGYAGQTDNVELGQALLDHFQGNRWQATARVMTAEAHDRLDAQHALGLLYLAERYAESGDTAHAETLYRQLTTAASGEIQDQAWLAIARFAIERKDADTARQALKRSSSFNATAKSEHEIIDALALLLEGQQQTILDQLAPATQKDSVWALYQRYNLGVTLLGKHRNSKAAAILHQLGGIESGGNAEIAAIKDRANVALGYTLLQLNNPAEARQYFEKVQLDSLLTNTALLGLGWTYAIENNSQKSLVYWLALSDSPKNDHYRLEALLAVPYAYSQAGAYGQAAQHYQNAIDIFTRENDAVVKAQHFIQSSGLTASLNGTPSQETAWAKRWSAENGNALERFLPLLMDNSDFQRSLRQYRLLLKMEAKLGDMRGQLGQLRNHSNVKGVKTSIADLSQREKNISRQLDIGIKTHSAELEALALELLNTHHRRLTGHIRQARFGLAQMIEKTAFGEALPR